MLKFYMEGDIRFQQNLWWALGIPFGRTHLFCYCMVCVDERNSCLSLSFCLNIVDLRLDAKFGSSWPDRKFGVVLYPRKPSPIELSDSLNLQSMVVCEQTK